MTEAPPEVSSQRLARSSAVVALGTALSRLTGFARIAALGYALGSLRLTDTYSLANESPNLVYELLLGGVLAATLVPIFVEHREKRDDDATSAVLSVATAALAALTVLGLIATPLIARIYTLNVSGAEAAAQRDVATSLMFLFMPQILFYGFTALATALLNANRRFAAAAFAPVLNNVVVICLFLAIPRMYSEHLTLATVQEDTGLLLLLGLGTTAGVAAMALVLVPAVRRLPIHFRVWLQWRHPAVRKVVRLSGWTIAYIAANQAAVWCILPLANGTDGGVFAYMTGFAFFQMPHGLFAATIMTTLTPEMASAAGRLDWPRLRRQFGLGLRMIGVVIIPASAALIVLARPLVRVFLQHGAFSPTSALLIADTTSMFGIGLLFFSVYLFTLRAFYAQQDTRTPFLVNCVENALNIAFAFPLYHWLGVPGLALAFSLAYMISTGLALAVLGRRVHGLDLAETVRRLVRMTVAGIISGGAAWIVVRVIGTAGFGRAVVALIAGGLTLVGVYLLLLTIFRVDELRRTVTLVLRRSN